jgi:hypothetical protein
MTRWASSFTEDGIPLKLSMFKRAIRHKDLKIIMDMDAVAGADRLYQIEGTKLAGGSNTDPIRFQQSLTFDRNVANRTPQQMQAIRAACVGINANPAGLDDPRCVRQ